MATPGHRGELLKKAGGKATDKRTRLLDRWSKRWFVLAPGETALTYYKSEDAQVNGEPPLGVINVAGATVFLKEVRAGHVYRFSVKNAARELKLRAESAEEYDRWMSALQPIAESFREMEEDGGGVAGLSLTRDRAETVADGDSDGAEADDLFDADDEQSAFSARPPSGRGASSSRGSSSSVSGGPGALGLPPPPGRPSTMSLAGPSIDESAEFGAPPAGHRGFLEKKSGGKEGRAKWKLTEKWSKRWFVLAPEASVLRYYKSEGEAMEGKEPLGVLECAGATVFLKEVQKGGAHRFTVRAAARELKLRAGTKVSGGAVTPAPTPTPTPTPAHQP